MKKRIFALLCALALLLPALCMAYVCDSCDYDGPFTEVVTGEEVRDGAPGVWYETVCPNCGAPSPAIPPSWRQTGPAVADPPPQTVQTNPELPKTDPEPEVKTDPAPQQEANSGQPVTVQPEAQSPGTGNAAPEEPALPPAQPEVPAGSGGTENAVQPAPERPAAQQDTAQVPPVSGPEPADSQPQPADSQPQPAAEPLPPVPEGNSAPEQSAPQPGNAPEPETAPDEPAAAPPAGNTDRLQHRDFDKYPIFSVSRPSRRLNLEGDPDAWAPIPGEKIYPPVPEEGSSILRHMLDGD